MEKLTFLTEEIFSDIPGDPDNVIMTIPPEICESQGWKEGDIIIVTVDDGKLILSKQHA
jgi:AbrB family looped-hinge helix DNA binding protein